MKTYSIMQAQHNLSSLLREVGAGYEVQITRRKQVVARVLPAKSDEEDIVFPDFAERAKKTWDAGWRGSSTDSLVDEARGNA